MGLTREYALLLTFLVATQVAAPPQKNAAAYGPDAEVKEFRVSALEANLQNMQPGPERDFFAGVLANWNGRVDDSILLLNRALPGIRESQPKRAALALETLADDYTKSFRYTDAARTYDDLLAHFAGQLDRGGANDDSDLVHLLQAVPAQTITMQGPVRLKTERNPIGSLVTELTVNGVRGQWLLDTGANQTVVTRSFGRELGLRPLPGSAKTGSGVTGIANPLQVAVLPTLQMGGGTLKNVVVLILEDANLNVGKGKHSYQINAILGYPVFQALGTITFLHSGGFEAGVATQRTASSVRMYMRRLTPVIECRVGGNALPFTFDTGASETDLSIRYYEQFRGNAGSWKQRQSESSGAGGTVKRTVYVQPNLVLNVGDKTATLENVSIFPARMNSGIDELYGNLGQDLVAGFESFTLDFSRMTFSLGSPLAARKRR
jgi:Aspartyl protease